MNPMRLDRIKCRRYPCSNIKAMQRQSITQGCARERVIFDQYQSRISHMPMMTVNGYLVKP
jgi:hypothetical protein